MQFLDPGSPLVVPRWSLRLTSRRGQDVPGVYQMAQGGK